MLALTPWTGERVIAIDYLQAARSSGNQSYAIPDEVELDHYDTVVIWCLPFTTSFRAADLEVG